MEVPDSPLRGNEGQTEKPNSFSLLLQPFLSNLFIFSIYNLIFSISDNNINSLIIYKHKLEQEPKKRTLLHLFFFLSFLSHHHQTLIQDSPFSSLITMGTEVIRPQNCLVNRMRDSPATIFHHPRRNHPHRKPPLRPDQRRRFGSVDFRTTAKDIVRRRGESFDSFSNIKNRRSNGHEVVSPDDIYAGSSIFVVSPAPSSLPLPSFSRRDADSHVVVVSVDDSASQDLRRLLRLEF